MKVAEEISKITSITFKTAPNKVHLGRDLVGFCSGPDAYVIATSSRRLLHMMHSLRLMELSMSSRAHL